MASRARTAGGKGRTDEVEACAYGGVCSPLHAEIFARQGKVVSADRMAPSERHENPALAATVVAARRSVARILCRRGVTRREVETALCKRKYMSKSEK